MQLWKHRYLIKQFAIRDIASRYRGSYLGITWSFLYPFIMLLVYTFVFSVVFESKWGTDTGNKVDFAIILFAGMSVYGIFSEVVNRSSGIIISNVNYVKKVVFPLEIFPLVLLFAALVQFAISCVIILIAVLSFKQTFHWTMIYIPIVIAPLCLMSLGLAWIFSALGVFLRDIGQILSVVISALMFLSPIFYPTYSVPKDFELFFRLNPIAYVVEDFRQVVFWGQNPNWEWILVGALIGALVSYIGYMFFMKTKKGFADVL